MTTETASLMMRVESKGAKTATQDFDNLTSATERTERASESARNRIKQLGADSQAASRGIKALGDNVTSASTALGKMQADYARTKTALQQFLAEQVAANRTIDENGNVFTAHGVRAAKLSEEYQRLRLQYTNAANSNDKLADSMVVAAAATDRNQLAAQRATERQIQLEIAAEEVRETIQRQVKAFDSSSKSMGGMVSRSDAIAKQAGVMGRKIAQASIQVEQLFSTIAAGANPASAFAFQMADIGIVLGAPLLGAIAGITASLAGPFINSLFGGEKATDALASTLERLDTVATRQDGVIAFTDSLRELSKVSEVAARARIDAAIINAEKAASLSAKSIQESIEDSLDLDGFFASLEGAVNSAKAFGDRAGANLITGIGRGEANSIADEIGKSFGLAGDEARKVGVEVVELIANLDHPVLGGGKAFESLENRLSTLAQSAGKNREKTLLMAGALAEFFDQGRKASKTADDLKTKLDQLGEGEIDISVDPKKLQQSQSYMERLAQDVALAELKLSGSDEEAQKLSVALSNGYATFEQMPQSAQALVDRLIDINEQQEDQNKKLKEQEKLRAKMGRAELTESNLLNSLERQIIAYEDGAKAAYEFGVAQQLGFENADEIPDHIQNQIDKLYDLKEAQDQFSWDNWLESAQENLTQFDELSANVIEGFSQRFGDAFESVIFDSQSVGDAVQGMMQGLARSTINALGQMAAQWLAYQAVQLLVGKSTAVAGAASLTAEAQAASLLAGIHAFSSTAAIPVVGPPAAPAAMGAALAVTQPMAAAVGAIATGGALAGMAHDGIDNIPREGTWLLDRGERVVDQRTNADLKQYLKANNQQQASSNSFRVNVTNHFQGNDEQIMRALENQPRRLSRIISRVVNKPI